MTDIRIRQDRPNRVHDLEIENGDLALVSGADEIRQDVDVRLRTYQGELPTAPSTGTPWYQLILPAFERDRNYDLDEIELVLADAILSAPGVLELSEDGIQIDDSEIASARRLSIAFTVKTTNGENLTFDEVFAL